MINRELVEKIISVTEEGIATVNMTGDRIFRIHEISPDGMSSKRITFFSVIWRRTILSDASNTHTLEFQENINAPFQVICEMSDNLELKNFSFNETAMSLFDKMSRFFKIRQNMCCFKLQTSTCDWVTEKDEKGIYSEYWDLDDSQIADCPYCGEKLKNPNNPLIENLNVDQNRFQRIVNT